MIDLAIGTYVDNQDAVKYPVGYLTTLWKDFASLFWFTSDDENAAILEQVRLNHPLGDRIKIKVVGQKIRVPDDLMLAYPKCIGQLRLSGCKFIALQEADLALTDDGVDCLRSSPDSLGCFSLAAMQNKLFCETWHNPVGCVVLPANAGYECGPASDWDIRVNGDKIRPIEGPHGSRMMLDLGYASPDAFYRKMLNHSKIWPDTIKLATARAFERSRREGILAMAEIAKGEVAGGILKPVAYEGQYRQMIDGMGLKEDYDLIVETLA